MIGGRLQKKLPLSLTEKTTVQSKESLTLIHAMIFTLFLFMLTTLTQRLLICPDHYLLIEKKPQNILAENQLICLRMYQSHTIYNAMFLSMPKNILLPCNPKNNTSILRIFLCINP